MCTTFAIAVCIRYSYEKSTQVSRFMGFPLTTHAGGADDNPSLRTVYNFDDKWMIGGGCHDG